MQLSDAPPRSLAAALVELTLLHPQPALKAIILPLWRQSCTPALFGVPQRDIMQRLIEDGMTKESAKLFVQELSSLDERERWSDAAIAAIQHVVNRKVRAALQPSQVLAFLELVQKQAELQRSTLKFWG